MASDASNDGGSKRKAPPKTIRVNPYAKKNKTKTKNNTTSNSNDASTSSAAKLAPVQIGDKSAASFSQAFAGVDNTNHFRSAAAAATSVGARVGKLSGTDQKEQRELEEFQAVRDERARLQARKEHELLQPHVLHVSTRQRGNGVLKYIRNVPYAFTNMVPDYIMQTERCALFLSMKYHNLFPNYIHRRIAELKTDFKLRVLLVLVDVEDNANILLFLNRLAVVHDMTLILAWSEEEAARYLETFKAYDGKDATSIQKREQTNYADQVSDFLCSVRSVNKTDSSQLLAQFGSVRAIMSASMDELALCPGMGEKKVKRLFEAFHKPFKTTRQKPEEGKENDQDGDDVNKKPVAKAMEKETKESESTK